MSALVLFMPSAAVANNSNPLLIGGPGHPLLLQPPGPLATVAAPAGAHLSYYGGRVVSNLHVVQVLYGAGSYLPNVSGTGSPSLSTFYQGVLNSAYVDWLNEYDTNISAVDGNSGTNQSIGRGTFVGQYLITPSPANSGGTITDAQIQSELAAQIVAGNLPAPTLDAAGNDDTYYAIFFPHGVTITAGGYSSCVAGGFCAYHGTIASVAGYEVYYGVHPDMQAGSGCESGCGNGTTFQNATAVASHEMIETMTDPEVSLAFGYASPLAWYDVNNGEIGDICNAQQGTITGSDGVGYTVQAEWSNLADACIVAMPVTPTPTAPTGTPTDTATITPTNIGGFTSTPSGTPTRTPSPPPTPTSTRTPTATRTSTPTVTLTGTPTPIGFLQAEFTPNDGGGGFGFAVALSTDGNTALIGAPLKTVGTNPDQGEAYVFVREGTTWTQRTVLTASDGAASDGFGWAVALSRDGNTALIGAPSKTVGGNAYEGVAYIFARSGATWTQQGTLVASDGAYSDDFGCAVALSDDGAIALVGSQRNTGRGAAYVFVRSGVTWTEETKLSASDAAVLDQFGSGVALSGDATIAFVGADERNHGQGALYIFEWNGSVWTELTEVTATDGAKGDNLGFAVAAASDGATVLVGAQNKDSGSTVNQGAAYVFARSGATWFQQAELTAADAADNDVFGYSVALGGDASTALVGAYDKQVGNNVEQGAVYVGGNKSGGWGLLDEITASDGRSTDAFGYSTALSGDGSVGLVGAFNKNSGQGAAYVFQLRQPPPTPTETASVTVTSTASSTAVSTPTDTPSSTPTDTLVAASTATETATVVAIETDTATPVPSATPTATALGTPTTTPTGLPAATATPTATAAAVFSCAPVPRVGCLVPARAKLALKNSNVSTADTLAWRWVLGEHTALADFGDPLSSTSYSLCIYDQSGGVAHLALAALVPAGGMCGSRPCWKAASSTITYRNRDRAPDGISVIRLHSGTRAKTTIVLEGHGANLKMPAPSSANRLFDQNPALTVQLVKSDGGVRCWEAVYPAPAIKNSTTRFTDRIP